MGKVELSEKLVKALTSEGRPDRLVADNRQAALYLRVLASGKKSWVVRTRVAKRWQVQTIGQWADKGPSLSVAQARLKAAAVLQKGLHPGAIDRAKLTVRQAADQWYRERVENRHRRPLLTKQYLDRDLRTIESKPISRVTRSDVMQIIAAKAPTAGNRLLAIIKQLFRYAATVEWIEADPISVLTARNVGAVEKPRERVLDDAEIRRAWAIEPPHGNLYRMLLASGQRLSEVLSLGNEDGQLRDGIWYIDDNKSGRPHRVPMTAMMSRIVKDGLPVKKRAAAWSMWKSRMQCDATVHDIRRTVATRLRELGVSVDVIEALLNHAPPRLVRTYQRPDMTPQIKDALELWQRHLLQLGTRRPPRPAREIKG